MKPEIFDQLRSFSPSEMMENADKAGVIIRKIRLKHGGIGSDGDELTLCRLIMDLKFMVDVADGLKLRCDELMRDNVELTASLNTIKSTYEKRLVLEQQKATTDGNNIQSAKVDI